ncbi:MAG TPA: ABC transporter ATP-binding protein [Ktedonobacterales bacterium]|nr:ABC transporter ATP-binding protein [Ktedonobacterales bacterium]
MSGKDDAKLAANDGLRVAVELRRGGFTLRATFHAPPGLTVLLGPSGAGKSLTLHAIAGLAPVAAGRVTLHGRTLVDVAAGVALPAQQRRVGYVPQSYALFPHLSVAENIAYGLPTPLQRPVWWDRAACEERARRVAALLRLVRLPGYEARRPGQLSGGEAQRVALARALAAEPAALLLDEPLSALDAPTRAAVRDDLRAIVSASGAPAILVTHDLAEARALGDRIVALVGGRVVAAGALAETLACPPTTTAARLFGWHNILPVMSATDAPPGRHAASTPPTRHAIRITLPTGQALTLAAPTDTTTVASHTQAGADASPTPTLALALRAERLALQAAHADGASAGANTTDRYASGNAEPSGFTLSGVVTQVTDEGAYYRVTVALDGEAAPTMESSADGTASLVATCSPREWAALSLAVGARVCVCAAPDAARLVMVDEQ